MKPIIMQEQLGIRVKTTERDLVEMAARLSQRSISEFVREAMIREARRTLAEHAREVADVS